MLTVVAYSDSRLNNPIKLLEVRIPRGLPSIFLRYIRKID